jgi:pimeloyl-ACP methyl ester carboxylesterase/acyl carrier protein
VIHAAAVLDEGVMELLDDERLGAVMTPKIDGAIHLHELTRDMPIAEMILCSSFAATFGGPGRASYAAANVFLEALAHSRRTEGRPGIAMAFGMWERTAGMAVLDEAEIGRMMERLRRAEGLLPIAAEVGMERLDTARAIDQPLLVHVRLDLAALRSLAGAGLLPEILQGLVRVPARRARDAGSSVARRLVALPESEREGVLLELVRSQVAEVLGHASADAIEPMYGFLELGLDSLAAVQLRNYLGQVTGLRLPATFVFDYPTPVAMAKMLHEQLADATPADGAARGHEGGGTLTELVRNASSDLTAELLPLLAGASRLLPAFDSFEELPRLPRLGVLATGSELPSLVCIPSFMFGLGQHQYLRFARVFDGRRTVSTMSLPGTEKGELVPASWRAAVGALAEAIAQSVEGPCGLVGYSIGGTLAYALAEELEAKDRAVAGLLLIDPYGLPETDEQARAFSHALDRLGHESASLLLNDDRLIMLGAYMRMVTEWSPGAVKAPRLVIRPSQALANDIDPASLPDWQLADTVVEIDGTHFTLIEEGAEATAMALDGWLAEALVR